MMTMNSHGMIAKTCFWITSVGAGLSFCWSHMVMPSRIGSTPMAMNDGGVNGNRPNRLTGVSGSGADRSLIHSANGWWRIRSEEHTSELQSLMRISYAVFFLKKNKSENTTTH